MNPEIKARWVQRLESEKDTQAKGRLKKGPGFCCLGVLCDMYIEETGLAKWVGDKFSIKGNIERLSTYLPGVVREWAGIFHSNPYYTAEMSDERITLARLNDDGLTFPQIAEKIKVHL